MKPICSKLYPIPPTLDSQGATDSLIYPKNSLNSKGYTIFGSGSPLAAETGLHAPVRPSGHLVRDRRGHPMLKSLERPELPGRGLTGFPHRGITVRSFARPQPAALRAPSPPHPKPAFGLGMQLADPLHRRTPPLVVGLGEETA